MPWQVEQSVRGVERRHLRLLRRGGTSAWVFFFGAAPLAGHRVRRQAVDDERAARFSRRRAWDTAAPTPRPSRRLPAPRATR